jgi:hypothetical protein
LCSRAASARLSGGCVGPPAPGYCNDGVGPRPLQPEPGVEAKESLRRLAIALVLTAIEVYELRRSADTESQSSVHHNGVDIAAEKRYYRRPRKGRRAA